MPSSRPLSKAGRRGCKAHPVRPHRAATHPDRFRRQRHHPQGGRDGRGQPCHLVMVGADKAEACEPLDSTRRRAGFQVIAGIRSGHLEEILRAYRTEHAIDLIVMGAYGHSKDPRIPGRQHHHQADPPVQRAAAAVALRPVSTASTGNRPQEKRPPWRENRRATDSRLNHSSSADNASTPPAAMASGCHRVAPTSSAQAAR